MEWGDPGADRYRKIVARLRSQVGNARVQTDKNMSDAIHDWDADLQWLQNTFANVYGSQ
jgi:hypothetical protein